MQSHGLANKMPFKRAKLADKSCENVRHANIVSLPEVSSIYEVKLLQLGLDEIARENNAAVDQSTTMFDDVCIHHPINNIVI